MKHLISKCLMVFSVIYRTFCLPFSSCIPATECEVLAQTSTGVPTGTSDAKTGESHSIAHGDPSARVFGALALLVICAALGRFGARKLKQSPVLGELAVGIIVGAMLYQLGSPTVIIIRHFELIQRTAENVLSKGNDWETTVRSTLGQAGLPGEVAERVEQVLLRK